MMSHDEILSSLQEALAYRFRDPVLLRQAVLSWDRPLSPESAALRQRLEFLGDAAWDFAVAAAAFRLWPNANAGELTRLRTIWCSTTGLAQLAKRIGLPPPAGPAAPPSSERVLAELLEAVLGATLADGGLAAIQALADRVVETEVATATHPPVDPKSALQILAQSRCGSLPVYRLIDRRGAPHQPTFRVLVVVSGKDIEVRGEAEGTTRQAAEQLAARIALERLSPDPSP